MIYAKIMPSPTEKKSLIISVISDIGWIGFAKKMSKSEFQCTCQDLAGAWEFNGYKQALSWIFSLQNLGLPIQPIWADDNKELTML